MKESTDRSARALMGSVSAADPMREELALAALQRELFDHKAPAPVLDRYVLLDKIGEGGLGVVFKAYDPDLDRQVALKLLRLREDAGPPQSSMLLQEARLMAQLSHPNVVRVYDVGVYSRRDLGLAARRDALGIPTPGVFLVMELMTGGSLRELIRRRASYREVMPRLLECARGICAAHDKGIVHRDFKPANVLLGEDGQARVADFGLATSLDAASGDGRAGTPAFMAPEQLRGGPADARSDQYAFALTCWVALFGTHPFDDETPRELDATAVPRGTDVPRRVHAVVRRALSLNPADRYPSMTAMTHALQAATVDRVRRFAMLGGGTALVAASVFAAWPGEAADPCGSAGAAIEQTWNDDARAQLRERFAATGVAFAASTERSVERVLDGYARQWKEASVAACRDTHVRHVQSEDVLDRRTACLERLRLELGEVVALMHDADEAILANAVPMAHGLGWIEPCSDPRRTPHGSMLPHDEVARTAVTDVWGQLARARGLEESGRYVEATALARSARDEAIRIEDAGLHAAAQLRLGSITARRGNYAEARAVLLRGIQLAEAARDDRLVADGWIRLVWVAGVELGDDEAQTWAGFAAATLDRLGPDPMRRAELDHNLGGVAYRDKRFEDALTHYERALQSQHKLLDDDDPTIARTLNHIANVLLEIGEPARALTYAQRSLRRRERVLGAQHPLVAASLNNMSLAQMRTGDLTGARASVDRALQITAGTGLPEETVAHGVDTLVTEAQAHTTSTPEAAVDGR